MVDKQEPVAWMFALATTIKDGVCGGWENHLSRQKPNVPEGSVNHIVPLYTRPQPKHESLTDEQIKKVFESYGQFITAKELAMIRAIEAIYGIKGD